jgi:radical SAM protein with 4Fe4S-binding SPASM domain
MNDYKLGSSSTEQISIDNTVDQEKIESVLLKDIEKTISHFSGYKDEYNSKFLDFLLKKKKIIFSLNKHEELYCKSIINNPVKICGYLIFRYKFRESGVKKISFAAPLYLLVEPVSTCNLRCPFCFQTDKSFTKKPYMGVMNFDLFKKIIDEADDLKVGAVTLASRGEPTLHKNFGDMLDYISQKKNIYEIKTNTNATFLDEKLCHTIFKNNITQVVISADHYLKEDYERLRLGANFEKILENVDQLFNIKKKNYPDSITEIRISGIDSDKNLDLKKFHEFWIKRSDHVSASLPMERWNTYENKEHPEINDPCQYLWDRMYIWFDGKTNPCDADYKSYLSYGDVSKDSIANVWNSKILSDIRNSHLDNKRNRVEPCNKCGVTFS